MNEKGVIYPTALCLLLIMSTLFLFQVNVNVSEQRMLHEIKTQETRQFLLLRASIQLTERIPNTPDLRGGVVQIGSEQITYSVMSLSDTKWQVSFNLLHEGVQIPAVAIYEKESGKLLNWLVPV